MEIMCEHIIKSTVTCIAAYNKAHKSFKTLKQVTDDYVNVCFHFRS